MSSNGSCRYPRCSNKSLQCSNSFLQQSHRGFLSLYGHIFFLVSSSSCPSTAHCRSMLFNASSERFCRHDASGGPCTHHAPEGARRGPPARPRGPPRYTRDIFLFPSLRMYFYCSFPPPFSFTSLRRAARARTLYRRFSISISTTYSSCRDSFFSSSFCIFCIFPLPPVVRGVYLSLSVSPSFNGTLFGRFGLAG